MADLPGCTVAGQLSGDEYASASLDLYRADVVLWDLGWDATNAIGHMAETGDAGLPPSVALVPDDTLLSALVAVGNGLAVLDPELEPGLSARGNAEASSSAELTPREADVLALLAEGLPNKAIANRLDISEHTVKFHVNAILGKLGAQSRTEAVTRATRMGLITL